MNILPGTISADTSIFISRKGLMRVSGTLPLHVHEINNKTMILEELAELKRHPSWHENSTGKHNRYERNLVTENVGMWERDFFHIVTSRNCNEYEYDKTPQIG